MAGTTVGILRVSSYSLAHGYVSVSHVGMQTGTEKGITLYLQRDELRLIRAALRFCQVNSERPLNFDQDKSAGALVATISVALNEPL